MFYKGNGLIVKLSRTARWVVGKVFTRLSNYEVTHERMKKLLRAQQRARFDQLSERRHRGGKEAGSIAWLHASMPSARKDLGSLIRTGIQTSPMNIWSLPWNDISCVE